MNNLSLYNLASMWIDTLESLDEIEDEDERNDAIQLVNNQMTEEIKNKAENIAKYNAHLDNQLDIVDKEIKRLQEVKKGIQANKDRFQKQVIYCMDLLNINSIETSHGSLTLRKNQLSVELDDEITLDDISNDFIRIKTVKELDKNAIKDMYKKGIKIKGIKYIDNKRTLNFK